MEYLYRASVGQSVPLRRLHSLKLFSFYFSSFIIFQLDAGAAAGSAKRSVRGAENGWEIGGEPIRGDYFRYC